MISFEEVLKVKALLDKAYCDLIYLLDHGYPKASALKFIADHYVMNKNLRDILKRVSFSKEQIIRIKKKQIKNPSLLTNRTLFVDMYNQLTTFFSLFSKDPIFICRDGLIRDIFSLIHNKSDLKIELPIITSFLEAVKLLSPKQVFFYLDSPISHSALHCELINESILQVGLNGECRCVKSVDYELKNIDYGVAISHDSIILLYTPSFFDFIMWYFNSVIKSNYPSSHIIDFNKVTCK
ncbi:MAG: DUF434 domain-containing protein [Candidatus Hodarchaeales archaeon]